MAKDLITITRWGGLGDVCMALCAAHALHKAGLRVTVNTDRKYHELVSACPHVAGVTASPDRGVDLSDCWFGIARCHQVDAYLSRCGLTDVAPADKSLDLKIPAHVTEMVARSYPANGILIHPSRGDANRTWPVPHWQMLLQASPEMQSRPVILIGDLGGDKAVHDLGTGFDARGLSPLKTVALMRQSKVLISADAGPIHLAGASDIGIIGIYSVVPGKDRLPFRHGAARWKAIQIEPACPHFPCYYRMHEPDIWRRHGQVKLDAGAHLGQVFGGWCPREDAPFACMREITPESVLVALREVLMPA